MPLYIYLFLDTCYAFTVLTCTGGVPAPKCCVLCSQIPCQRLHARIFIRNLICLDPTIRIYGAFGFLIITIEWKVWLRNDFKGVILTYVTFQPIFSKIRKIIKQLVGKETSRMDYATMYSREDENNMLNSLLSSCTYCLGWKEGTGVNPWFFGQLMWLCSELSTFLNC